MTTLSRRDLWKLRVYYAKQVLLGRWVYWDLLVYSMRRSPGAEHVPVGEVFCHHSWEADEDGVRCCVYCGVTDERDRTK